MDIDYTKRLRNRLGVGVIVDRADPEKDYDVGGRYVSAGFIDIHTRRLRLGFYGRDGRSVRQRFEIPPRQRHDFRRGNVGDGVDFFYRTVFKFLQRVYK